LKIETAAPSPVAELSKLTANGGPFSIEKAANTAVLLPASSSRDYNASLKIMAKLAKSSGHGWVDADYLRSANLTAVGTDKNVLIIGPSSSLNGAIRNGAPKGLQSALKGQSLDGTGRMASIDRMAASDEQTAMRLYAERQASTGRIRKGGVAALYPSPLSAGKVMGVITNTPGQSFSRVAGQLIKPEAWHNLEGSVARWDNSKVLMAQTAMAVPGFVGAAPKQTQIGGFKLPEISWPEFSLPKFDREAFEFGEIDMSTVSKKFESLKDSSLALLSGSNQTAKTDKVTDKIADKIIASRSKPEVTSVPKLRGMSTLPAANAVKSAKAKAAPLMQKMGDVMKDKLGLDPAINSNALATMIMAALAFLFLLLGLSKPSRKH
jgi:hypothetical protein